jgi:plastocyanin
MKTEWTGAKVGPDEFETKHPQLFPPRAFPDPQALRGPRPETELPEQRAIQHGYNPVGFQDIPGITPRNNLTALGEIGTVTITTSDSGNDDIAPSGVSSNALIGTVVINTTGDADVTVNPTGSAGTSAVGSPTVTGDTVYTVTVANPGSGNKYYIDGVLQPTLSLSEGSTYTFNWSAATGHPLRFSTTSDGTHGGGSEYTTGVTINTGAYTSTITVAVGAPTLFYYCQYHSGMGGQINTT